MPKGLKLKHFSLIASLAPVIAGSLVMAVVVFRGMSPLGAIAAGVIAGILVSLGMAKALSVWAGRVIEATIDSVTKTAQDISALSASVSGSPHSRPRPLMRRPPLWKSSRHRRTIPPSRPTISPSAPDRC
jgi:hypothetical protein